MLGGATIEARIRVWQGDITALDVDAIVNAANSALSRGGGVCGAIHAAAGPGLAIECARLGGCPTGEARLTGGYDLAARYVIHAVGPIWSGGRRGEEQLLAACYRHSLELATEQGVEAVAFPAISTGIYGYPAEAAARVAVREAIAYLQGHDLPREVILVAFSTRSFQLLDAALREQLPASA